MLREENDDVSTITGRIINAQSQNRDTSQVSQDSSAGTATAGATRSVSQLNLDQAGNAFNRRRLNAVHTQNKRKMAKFASTDAYQLQELSSCRVELDSHADTCGVNNVVKILEYHGQEVEVSGFAITMKPLTNIPIVKAAIAYDCPKTGETVILIINQALYFGNQLSHILLNPNQLRAYDIRVDIPRHLSKTSAHAIIIEQEKFNIPLNLKGIISYFDARTPTDDEIMNCQHIILTSDQDWNPNSSTFEELEIDSKEVDINIKAFNINHYEYQDFVMQKLNYSSNKSSDHKLFIKDDV